MELPAAASRSISALADAMGTVGLRAVLTVALSLEALAAVKLHWRVGGKRVNAVRGIVQAALLPRESGESKNSFWMHFLLLCNSPACVVLDRQHQLYRNAMSHR